MRCRLTKNVEGPNPDFDRSTPAGPDNERHRILEVGTELEDPLAWMLCVPDARNITRAEPVDDECRARVDSHMQRRAEVVSRMSAEKRAARETLVNRLPTLQEDGTNGPSPDASKTASRRRRPAGK